MCKKRAISHFILDLSAATLAIHQFSPQNVEASLYQQGNVSNDDQVPLMVLFNLKLDASSVANMCVVWSDALGAEIEEFYKLALKTDWLKCVFG